MIPLFLKEIRLLLRSGKAFGLLLGLLLLLGGIVVAGWSAGASRFGTVAGRAALGRSFFLTVGTWLFCLMGLVTPLMGATSFTLERETRTMDLLVCCGLGRVPLLMGKWLANVVYQLLVIACMAPVLSLVFVLGGVGFEEYCFAGAMMVLAVMTYGMLGVSISCHHHRSRSALIATFVRILLYTFALPLGIAILFGLFAIFGINLYEYNPLGNSSVATWFIVAPSPLFVWIGFLMGSAAGSAKNLLLSPIFIVHVLFQGWLFAHALRSGWKRLGALQDENPFFIDYSSPAPADSGFSNLGVEHSVEPDASEDPVPALPIPDPPPPMTLPPLKPHPLPNVIKDGRDPIVAREFGLCMGTSIVPLLFLFCFAVSMILIFPSTRLEGIKYLQCLAAVTISLVYLVAPVFAAGAISREREENTLDLLRATALGPRQIVGAKFRVVMRLMVILSLTTLFLPLYIRTLYSSLSCLENPGARSFAGPVTEFFLPVLLLPFPLGSFGALAIAICLYFSAGRRRSLAALALSYIVLAFLATAAMIPVSWLQHGGGLREWAGALLGLPLTAVNYFYYLFAPKPGMLALLDLNRERPLCDLAAIMILHAAVVGALAFGILRAAARRLEQEAVI